MVGADHYRQVKSFERAAESFQAEEGVVAPTFFVEIPVMFIIMLFLFIVCAVLN